MIITKLQGGLGNQLFQYALGRQVAATAGKRLALDISHFEHFNDGLTRTYDIRKYELAEFAVEADIATAEQVRWFQKFRPRKRTIWFLYNWLVADGSKYVRESDFAFNPNILKLHDPVYLDGIWLSPKYFQGIEQAIRAEITLKKPFDSQRQQIVQAMRNSQSVSLHIRRGDLVTSAKASSRPLSLEYYTRAVDSIARRISNPRFFVFSDEIEWAKINLRIPWPTTFVSNYAEISNSQELILMSQCKHSIMANSTFSWWGAWLNANPNKIVIAPIKMFKDDARTAATRDFIPAEWERL